MKFIIISTRFREEFLYEGSFKCMIKFFQKNIEPNRKLRSAEIIVLVLLIVGSLVSYGLGFSKVNSSVGSFSFVQTVEMTRDFEMEDYDL